MESSGGQSVDSHNSDLDSLSNLLINSYEDDAAALDAYESELERHLQETLLTDKERHNQRLFQSFQRSACNVAQMFKDKSSKNALSSWESFQNSAGAITVLYKDSLEACRVHMELGVHLGQQRKLKELISWVKKKKKRSIRKEELISFLIGKQYPSSQNQMLGLFNHQATANPFNVSNVSRQRPAQLRQRSSLVTTSNTGGNTSQASGSNSASSQASNQQLNSLNIIGSGDNSNGSEVETNSDLATFREALIMHNRSRDIPPNFPPPPLSSHHSSQSHNNHNSHHHHQHHTQSTNHTATDGQPSCDDLDCFFCEQIATHVEHRKRGNASLNYDMDSPTRKRGRFY